MAREKQKKLKWERTPMARHPDGIVSSDYAKTKPFIPSYEKVDDRPQMGMLMSMEYARIWRREKEEMEKTNVDATKNSKRPAKHNVPTKVKPRQKNQPTTKVRAKQAK